MQHIIDFFQWFLDLAQPDKLKQIVNLGGGAWVGYAVMSTIIFAETGLLIGVFLPGDSLLFAAGFLASQDVFTLVILWILLSAAGILGDAVNYSLGRRMSDVVFQRGQLWMVKQEHLLRARAFYEHYGPVAIIIARFVPILRTFVPFVAGVARMGYGKFALYNIVGGIGWVLSMTTAGYFLGQIPVVQRNFEKVILIIVALSVLPIVVAWWRHRGQATPAAIAPNPPAGEQPAAENKTPLA